jgi:hypothetical protein
MTDDPTRIELTGWHGGSAVYEREQPSPDAPALRTAIPYAGCGCREGGTRCGNATYPAGSSPCRRCRAGDHAGHRG